MAFPSYVKDPNAVLDYGFDWSNWLQDGESIVTAVWTIPTGITKDSQDESTTVTVVWLSGGTDRKDYYVSCKITTDNVPARTDERRMKIRVRNR